MSDDLDHKLRVALRPVDPPDGFAQRVINRATPKKSTSHGRAAAGWAAALLLVAFTGLYRWQQRSEAQAPQAIVAESAGREVLFALQLTSRKLHTVGERLRPPIGGTRLHTGQPK